MATQQEYIFQTETGEEVDPSTLGVTPEELAVIIAQATSAQEEESQVGTDNSANSQSIFDLKHEHQLGTHHEQPDETILGQADPSAAVDVDASATDGYNGLPAGTQFVDEHGNPIENPQFVDEHGNPVSLEQLAAQGVLLDGSDSLDGAEIIQLQEGQQIVQTEDGEMFIVQEDGTASQLSSLTQAAKLPPDDAVVSQVDTSANSAPVSTDSVMEVDLNTSQGSAVVEKVGEDVGSKDYGSIDNTPFFDPSVVKAPSKTNRNLPSFERGAITKGAVRDLNLKCQCPHCGRGFAAEHHLKRHIDLAHMIKKSFFCPPCNKDLSFMTSGHFEAHVRMAHNITKPFPWDQQKEQPPISTTSAISPPKAPARLAEISPTTMDLTPANQMDAEPPSIELQQTPQRLQSQKEAAAAISAEAAALGAVGEDTVYQCGACGAQFKETETLVAHISAEHMEDVNEAPVAAEIPPPPPQQSSAAVQPPSVINNRRSEAYVAQSGANKHFGISSGPYLTSSPALPAPYIQSNAMPAMGAAKDFEFYRCKFCQREFLSLSGLKKHIKDHPLSEEEKQNLAAELPATDADEDVGLRSEGVASMTSNTQNTQVKRPRGRPPAQNRNVEFDHLPYKCNICSHRFGTKDGLEAHAKTHAGEAVLSCEYCTRKFRTAALLQDHHRTSHPSQFACEVCTKVFTTELRLEDHMRTHAEEAPTREHQCTICERAFYERDSLAKHLREHGEQIFECEECDKKFVKQQQLERHMFVHLGRKDHLCSICGKVFSRRENLKAHRYLHSGEKPHKCDVCSAGFATKWALKNHGKMHSLEKRFMCEHCGRTFNHKHNLELHVRLHQNLRPFQCSSCAKTFSRLEHLQTHINDHERIRPYPCTRCDRAFFSSAHLSQHMRVHKGEQPFQCGSCEKSFLTKSRLQKHVKTHTKDEDAQYVVIWEKAGTILEAVIVTDGLSTATGPLVAAATANAPQITTGGVVTQPNQPLGSLPCPSPLVTTTTSQHVTTGSRSSNLPLSSMASGGKRGAVSGSGSRGSGYQPILPHPQPSSIHVPIQNSMHIPFPPNSGHASAMVATAPTGPIGSVAMTGAGMPGGFQLSQQLATTAFTDSKQVMPSQSMTLNAMGASTSHMAGPQGLLGLPPGTAMMDGQSVQFVDVHGNPIENFDGNEQFVVLDDSQLGHGQGAGTILQTSDGQTAIIDRNTLLALTGGQGVASGAAGAGNEETIFLTEEQLQSLAANQGVVFQYQ